MRTVLLALVLIAGCSKKKEGEGNTPASTAPATKTEESKVKTTEPTDNEKPTPTETAPAAAAGEPTKEAGIQRLKDLLAALEAKDYKKAVSFMGAIPNMPPEKMEEQIGKLLEINEISAKGIDILEAKATWGKLSEVFPEKAERWAKKFNVPVEQTWGFSLDNAEVGFHWDGKDLKIIRLDDVGKLQ